MRIVLPIEPDIPKEEGIDYPGIAAQESLKVQYRTVIEGAADADFVQTLGKALVVFDGIGIGLEDVGIVIELARSGGSILQEKIIVTVHTSYHAAP